MSEEKFESSMDKTDKSQTEPAEDKSKVKADDKVNRNTNLRRHRKSQMVELRTTNPEIVIVERRGILTS